MRFFCATLVFAALLSCNKPDSLIDPPPSQPSDSAKFIFVTATTNSNASSMVTYNGSGELEWEYAGLRPLTLWSQPTYGDKRLFVASFNQLLSMDAETGTARWQHNNQAPMVNPSFVRDTIVSAASTIAPSALNTILLFNKANSAIIWSKQVTEQPLVTPILDEGTIYNLTTNGTGTAITLTAYDVATKSWIWQKQLATGFLMSKPPDMMLRRDTLLVGSLSGNVTALNKYTGNVYWTKSFNSDQAFVHQNAIVFKDNNTGRVTKISLQTGAVTLQSAPIPYTSSSGGAAYIYRDAFYYHLGDSLFCTGLTDGVLKWRKAAKGYFTKFICVGETVYGSKIDYAWNEESRIMMMKASDFSVKDSIRIPKQNIKTFSVLSTANQFY